MACIGISKETTEDKNCGVKSGDAKFRVLGDGKTLKINGDKWTTKDFSEDAACFQLDIGNVSILELETKYRSHVTTCAYSTWANAAVALKGMGL